MADNHILLGGNGVRQIVLDAGMAKRQGLITGATGTGKTVTLQVLAESFSRLGVPVFTADIKGDLSGLAASGRPHPGITQRLEYIQIGDHPFEACPVLSPGRGLQPGQADHPRNSGIDHRWQALIPIIGL